ncbi:NAD(P)-dependent oxidoreductase [Limosilactobacillus panis]|jgi:3-hydroxyisobutyrate dehydrogenase|uniref:NAD(P)-dependent oxidoreductase n=1 Tax=Limosilactobacillus panis TaxID=47493 RepID=UPI001C95EDC3|nr:NAD(P)-dependent oxidoreductase [Limosilactobacillus panis]QZN93576.1 NAD(P)-dependent oxidoreductase [Limosilactobacillus panis]
MKIGFIGTGVMGTGIINNLLKHGNDVTVYNRTKAHAQAVLDQGAKWATTPAAATTGNQVVFTMVGFPQDVEEVYYGKDGVLAVAQSGQYLVDMTTSRPSLAQRIANDGGKKGARVIDAPVSGGDVGAKNGTLTVMLGGQRTDVDAIAPVLDQFSASRHYFGPAGSGQHAKAANQIMIAGTMTGMTEMLVYAKQAGLDSNEVIKTVGGGAAANWSLSNYGPRVLEGDYTPGFFAKHFLKDLRIALEEADKMNLELPATKEAKRLYEKLVDKDRLGSDGTQALIKLWWK